MEVSHTWVGTPWLRNQSCKGVGADCIGVVAGIFLECGFNIKYRNDYSQQPDGSLRKELRKQLTNVHGAPQPGDVLMMAFDKIPHHVALYIGGDIVHAYAQVRRCVIQPYDVTWKQRTKGVFSVPGIS